MLEGIDLGPDGAPRLGAGRPLGGIVSAAGGNGGAADDGRARRRGHAGGAT